MTIRDKIVKAKQEDMLTVEQLALLLQYAPNTIYRKARRGEIPGMRKYGRSIRFVRILALQWGKVLDRPTV